MKLEHKHITHKPEQRLLKLGGVVILCLFMGVISLHAQTPVTKEYKVKAAFIYNFIQFVEWPVNSLNNDNSPFVIGILGDDPFGNSIDELIAGEKIRNHPIIVQRYRDVKEIKNCHILYIGTYGPETAKEYIDALQNRNILTVSDNGSFARVGGMIRFFTQNNKIRLQINTEAAKAAELNISSKLLRVSEIYDPGKP